MKKKATIKKIYNNKIFKTLMLVFMDILLLFLCSIFALGIRFDFKNIPQLYIENVFNGFFLEAVVLIVIFSAFKLYSNLWKYATSIDLSNILLSSTMFVLVEFAFKISMNLIIPRSYYVIKLILLFVSAAFVRYADNLFANFRDFLSNRKRTINTMIVGAGFSGSKIIQEIYRDENSKYRIRCIIDDDKNKTRSYIKNIPIVGNRTTIKENAEKFNIKEIIIAIPSANRETINLIIEECQKTNCEIKILPALKDLTFNKIISNIRPISFEDFLERKEIIVDINKIQSNLQDKVVLVTGGGGSIGSELCRQIAKTSPKRLIIFDIYENNAYEIEQELKRTYPNLCCTAIIGSVRDYDRLEVMFKEYKPEFVFHAAAHKHVPLMEDSPNEAIKNNCLGTLNVVKASDKYKVKKFVLVSTDKAVRPTNIMGASKRICEMIIQTYDKISKTDYVAVRFGNVLGSNGSVIPLFLKQIENGGPVTVTHKEITRYFMTIPEATSLILQAFVYAEGGEIFVLNMGEPVKIYDLAKKLIRFKGYEPNVDMEIKITGLRPGEKLYEELLMDEEGLKETPNKLIHIGRPIEMNEKVFLKDLEKLIKESYKNNSNIKEKVAKIVDTYTIDKGGK